MAYNRIIPLGGGTDLLPDDNVWTGTNLFSNNISTTFEAQADNDIPNLKTVQNIANGGYRPKSPVKVVSHTNIVFLAGLDPITNSNGQVVNIIADELLKINSFNEEDIGYLPLVNDQITDWIVILSKNDARPLAYMHADGWGK